MKLVWIRRANRYDGYLEEEVETMLTTYAKAVIYPPFTRVNTTDKFGAHVKGGSGMFKRLKDAKTWVETTLELSS